MASKMTGRRAASILCLCTAFALAGQSAKADLLFSEDFAYANGDLTAVSGGLWVNHSGTVNFVQVVAGRAVIEQGNGSREDVNRPLGFIAGPGSKLYAAFDLIVDGGTSNVYFAHFKNSGSGFVSRIFIAPPALGNGYTLGLSGSGGSPAQTWPNDLAFNVTYRVVTSYNYDDGAVELWVDPVNEADTKITDIGGAATAVEAYALRQASGNSTQSFDNMCVATTFVEALTCMAAGSTGACILPDTTCIVTTPGDCAGQGGAYQGDSSLCPDTGACCLPDGSCNDQINADACAGFGGAFRGIGAVCTTPGLCDCMTIHEIKETGLLGSDVIVCEATVVETVDQGGQMENDRSFTVQDESGVANGGPGGTTRGLRVVGDNGIFQSVFDQLSEGDRIRVFGTLEDYGGTLYVRAAGPDSIVMLGGGGAFNVPAITVADLQPGSTYHEELESVRVTLSCVGFVSSGGTFGSNATFLGTDGTVTFPFRINEGDFATNPLVGTTIPAYAVDVVGVFSEFGPPQLYLHETDDLTEATCSGQLGACCVSNGDCYQTTQAICESSLNTFLGIGVPCMPGACVAATGACCLDGICTADLTQSDCAAGGGFYLGDDTGCGLGCPDVLTVKINEIRIDHGGDDVNEYFELSGAPGTPLGSLTYIVIGDGTGGSGVVEAVVPLAGQSIQADGLFLVGKTSTLPDFPGATVDLAAGDALVFENSDNVTHMLVQDFSGTVGDDLDTNNDCTLDVLPWGLEIDRVALVLQDNPPTSTECHYGPPQVGPDGSFVPGHVYRCTFDPGGPWFVGAFALGVDDTPDAQNTCLAATGACCFEGGGGGGGGECPCPGNFDDTGDSMGRVDLADVAGFVSALLSGTDVCADINGDTAVNGLDIAGMVTRVLNLEACGVASSCQQLMPDECAVQGGTYIGDNVPCSPDPCGATGACCAGAPNFECAELTEAQCTALFPERVYNGDGMTCLDTCALEAVNIEVCSEPNCTSTQWCNYWTDEINLAGTTCNTIFIGVNVIISIPCDGECETGEELTTFRWVGGGETSGDCIFTASPTFVQPTPACNDAFGGQTFEFVD